MPAARIDGKTGLRIGAVLALLIAVLAAGGRQYVQALLPLYRVVIDFAHPKYRVRSLEIDNRSGALILAELERRTLARDTAGKLRPALVVERVSTQMGYVLAHPFILLGVALVWPGLTARCRLERLALSLPLLLLVEMLDIPIVLAAGVDNALATQGQSGAGINWRRLMDGGGRYALCFAAAGIATAIHALWTKSRDERIRRRAI